MASAEEAGKALGVSARAVQLWVAQGAPVGSRPRADGRPGKPGKDYDPRAIAEWAFASGRIDAHARRRAHKMAGTPLPPEPADEPRAAPAPRAGSADGGPSAIEPGDLKSQKLAAQVRRLEEDIRRLTLGNAAKSGEMIEVAEARRILGVFAAKIREAGLTLQREHGPKAYAIMEAAYRDFAEALGK